MLAQGMLQAFAERHRSEPKRLDAAAIDVLRMHPWPGNVRELRSVLEHLAIVVPGSLCRAADVATAIERLPRRRRASESPSGSGKMPLVNVLPLLTNPASAVGATNSIDDGSPLRKVERDMILAAFEENGRNLSRAAKMLGIPRSTLRDKLRRYGVR
jgi:DNA-binding NtrC family response regulator